MIGWDADARRQYPEIALFLRRITRYAMATAIPIRPDPTLMASRSGAGLCESS